MLKHPKLFSSLKISDTVMMCIAMTQEQIDDMIQMLATAAFEG